MGKSPEAEVAEYRASIHYGLCVGPVDKIFHIEIDGKFAWAGEVSTYSLLDIYQPQLFGGPLREGGADGVAYFLPGGPSQVMPDRLADRLLPGAVGAGVPGFRGMTSLFFVGSDDRGVPSDPEPLVVGSSLVTALVTRSRTRDYLELLGGFVWSHNSPYIKPMAARVQRASIGLDPVYAMILDATDVAVEDSNSAYSHFQRSDSNPAHIIYECLTNTDWGMGNPTTGIDKPTFEACAVTLFNEDFGISMEWQQQTTIQQFIDLVISHVEGAVFIHPETGLWTMTLFRDDYSESDLPVFDTTNANMESFGRRLLGETINEMTITWTNPENLKSEPLTIQDLGNIVQQGQIVAGSRSFPGIRRPDLAAVVCQRELRAACAALATATVQVNRVGWNLVPGSVIKLTFPAFGLDENVYRVLDVEYGRSTDRTIKLAVVEDIFARPYAVHFGVQELVTDPLRVAPTELTNVTITTAPAYFQVRGGLVPLEDGVAVAMVFAAPNNADGFVYDMWTEGTLANGDLGYFNAGSRSMLRRAVTIADMAAEVTTTMALPGGTPGVPPAPNSFIMLGSVEGARELAFLSAYDAVTGLWTIKRGVLDTIPVAWPTGTELWITNINTPFVDTTVRAPGATAKYKILQRTSMGTFPIEDAIERTYTLIERPERPLRPANCKLNGGTGFALVAAGATPLTATWALRNRDLEDAQVLYWDDPGVTPEVGQTTTLRIYAEDSNSAPDLPMITEITGLTGETRLIDDAELAGLTAGWIEFIAVRDGLESFQSHKIHFTRTPESSNSP